MATERLIKESGIKFNIIFVSITILLGWLMPGNLLIAQGNNTKAFERNKHIGRGINFGNALEAPNEGEWGLVIKESYIQAVADAGFNSVRLPICWSAHTGSTYPYSIDPAFLHRVDEIMKWCLDRNLAVIITIHHFNDLYDHPDDPVYLNMFFAIWKQLTDHYLSVDHERLFFEVLNEPEVNLTAEKWNQLMPKIIDTIRVKDNDRTLIIDGPDYAYHKSLEKLNIPASEQNVIVSTRYYLPYQFAQQGSWWNTWTDMNQYLGTTWSGKDAEKSTVREDMAYIKNWSVNNNRPVTMGEYGSIMFADNQSRLTWTNYVRTQFENNNFSWSYFDFGVVFKIYSIAENKWLNGFVEALTGNSSEITDRRRSDSIIVKPGIPSEDDAIQVKSYIRIPNYCSRCDSVKVKLNGFTIKITTWHPEYIPQHDSLNTCTDSVNLGRYATGNYKIIFETVYVDKVNTLRYSVRDSADLQISGSTAVSQDKTGILKVYPIPASQFLMVDNADAFCLYQIYDAELQLQSAGCIKDGIIQTSGLKSGIYFLRITENGRTILNRKIMVMH